MTSTKTSSAREYPSILALDCQATFVLAADGDEKKRPTFKMSAYDGKPMKVSSWMDPVVIDYAGLSFGQSIPIRRGHDAALLVGHSTAIEVKGNKLQIEGVMSFENAAAEEVAASARNGFPWQASVGVQPTKIEYFAEGTETTVNGMKVTGPIDVIRKGTLKETSFVDLGASGGTKVAVVASATESQMTVVDPKIEPGETAPVKAADTATAPIQAADTDAAVKAQRTALADDMKRIAEVQAIAKGHPTIAAQAIGGGWSKDKTELEVLRASRQSAPAVGSSRGPITAEVLEAAVCMSGRLTNVEKVYNEQTIDAAHKQFPRSIGLQELIIEAAQMNGWTGRSLKHGDLRGALQAAFSTTSLPGILSNAANKFVLQGWSAVEQVWRAVAGIANVSDFKQTTSYRLGGDFDYREVAPTGELEHGSPNETEYTNQAKTYGRMYVVSRTDIINDDLGALTAAPMKLGRGGATKLNSVFWTAFLNNASFFSTGNLNYFEGAGTTLQYSQLGVALQKFREQTDPDGNPMALAPKFLLVPPALEIVARGLFNSLEVRDTTASTKSTTANSFAGMFQPMISAYLSNTTISGSSSTAWYLLADPMDMAVIEVAFLNGVEEPTVETADADFNTLGIQMRGYHDFGVAKQEFRAGVKSKGAA